MERLAWTGNWPDDMRSVVETRSGCHELHDGSRTPRRIKLKSGRDASALVRRVGVGHVPVDVATGSESTDEDDGAIGKGFCGRVPAHLLQGEHGGVVEPLTVRGGQIEDMNGLSGVIVVVG